MNIEKKNSLQQNLTNKPKLEIKKLEIQTILILFRKMFYLDLVLYGVFIFNASHFKPSTT